MLSTLNILLQSISVQAGGAGTAFYQDSRFFVLVSLVLFFALLIWKGVQKSITSGLDDRAEKIRADLDEARRLREEAQTLLASYHRKQAEAEQLAQDIVTNARREAEVMASDARAALAQKLERRTQMAEEKIANAEAQAMIDVRARAAELATQAAETLLRKQLKPADHKRLVADGIKQMGKALH